MSVLLRAPAAMMYRTQVISTGKQCHAGMVIAILLTLAVTVQTAIAGQNMGNPLSIKLPEPRTGDGTSVEQALRSRRSVRTFAAEPLKLSEVAQLLWSAQGITNRDGLRTAPSAGALYPLEIYLVAGSVNDLPGGIWHYLPDNHRLEHLSDTDVRPTLAHAALDQAWIREAAAVVVFYSSLWTYNPKVRQAGNTVRTYRSRACCGKPVSAGRLTGSEYCRCGRVPG